MAKVLKRFLFGVIAAVVLIGTKLAIEKTPFGQWAEAQTYGLLVRILPNFAKDGSPVQVLDISHLVGRVSPDGKRLEATDRKELFELLNAIAAQQPLAIGVDSDFSPTGERWTGRWVTDDDPMFFEQCKDLSARTKVPIYLGVYRTIREQPKAWLGVPAFKDMAAGLWLPRPDARRLPLEFWAGSKQEVRASDHHNEAQPGKQTEAGLPSLGAALARRALRGQARGPALVPRSYVDIEATRQVTVDLDGIPLEVKDAMVDYSLIDQIELEKLVKVTPADVRKYGERLRGRVVLLGHALDDAGDKFRVPVGDADRNGIFLHAALASSLIAHPLYEFKHGTRLLFDAVISIAIIGIVAMLLRKGNKTGHDEHALEKRVLMGAVAVVLVFGIAFVAISRVVWLDFLLVVFFLLLHPAIETRIKALFGAKPRPEDLT